MGFYYFSSFTSTGRVIKYSNEELYERYGDNGITLKGLIVILMSGFVDANALDLLEKLLEFELNCVYRISASDALNHPFLL